MKNVCHIINVEMNMNNMNIYICDNTLQKTLENNSVLDRIN